MEGGEGDGDGPMQGEAGEKGIEGWRRGGGRAMMLGRT
jgi:hypothetical protein